MSHMDIFNADCFTLQSMVVGVNKLPYLPTFLGELGLFTVKYLTTEDATFEQQDGTLNLIQTTPRYSPLEVRQRDPRSLRTLKAPRIAKADQITASQLANLRAFATENEFVSVQQEVATRQQNLKNDVALTWENMRLGAVQGIVYDADGTTVLYNLYDTFGVTQPDEIDFDLDNANPAEGALRSKCTQVLRAAQRAAGNAWIENRTYLYGICDDTFYDQFIAHTEYRAWQLGHPAAVQLTEPTAFREFDFAGIRFRNYRGTDEPTPAGKEVKVASGKCKFFPVNGAPDLWQAIFTPGEFFGAINRPGQPVYPLIIPDRDRDSYANVELYSYPLFVNTRPKCLQRARNT